jgi:hypothetical protein
MTRAAVATASRKMILTASLAVVAGVALYEARKIFQQRDELDAARAHQAALRRDLGELQHEHFEATRKLASLRQAEAWAQAHRTQIAEWEAELKAWEERVILLKDVFAQLPEQRIPEMKILSPWDWMEQAKDVDFNDTWKLEATLRHVRYTAKSHVALYAGRALQAYLDMHDGRLPADVAELAQFFSPPPDPEIVQRYEMIASGAWDSSSGPKYVIAEKLPVVAGDYRMRIGPETFDPRTGRVNADPFQEAMNQAATAYAADHPEFADKEGHFTILESDYEPYLSSTQKLMVKERMARMRQEASQSKP